MGILSELHSSYVDLRMFVSIMLAAYFVTEKTRLSESRFMASKYAKTWVVLAIAVVISIPFLWIDFAFHIADEGSISRKVVAYLAATSLYELIIKPIKREAPRIISGFLLAMQKPGRDSGEEFQPPPMPSSYNSQDEGLDPVSKPDGRNKPPAVGLLFLSIMLAASSMHGISKDHDRKGPDLDVMSLYGRHAVANGISPEVVEAVAEIESSHNPRAVSRTGAIGLMQVTPRTAAWFCKMSRSDLFSPEKNVSCGAAYLAYLVRMFNGDVFMAVSAYYAGPGVVGDYLKGTNISKRNPRRMMTGGMPPGRKDIVNHIRKFALAYGRAQHAWRNEQ